ncbi:MAG: hypothetical protein NVSMB18_21620 [Acetobacteraceae bacterium]
MLLPVRNGEATLAAAAGSILRQSLSALELLIVDDGSCDATPAVLERLAAADARVRVLRQGALGLVAALNRGLGAARAPLVARMDADDVALPERLARQAAVLASRPEVALVGTGWRVVAEGGVTRRVVLPPETDAGIRAGLAGANVLGHPTVMFRRSAVLALGGYRPAFLLAEDYDLWLRLIERHAVACVGEVLLEYRQHRGQSAWRDLEQRIVSEMSAQAAAACRAAGRPDHGEDPAPIDRARLLAMGMRPAEIAAGVIARALGAAKDAQAAGHWAAMRAAVRLGRQQAGLRARTRVHFGLLGAVAVVRGLAAVRRRRHDPG